MKQVEVFIEKRSSDMLDVIPVIINNKEYQIEIGKYQVVPEKVAIALMNAGYIERYTIYEN